MEKKEKLLEVKFEIHKSRLKRLCEIEEELAEMISKTGNEKIINKFLDWKNQKSLCGNAFSALLKTMDNF